MYKGSLLERLTSTSIDKDFKSYEESLYFSIASNLSKIFSSNAGSSEIALDYGRPDLDNMHLNMNDSIKIIEKRSKSCINIYEPRLHKCKVDVSKDRLIFNEMRVLIEGFVYVNGIPKRVTFNADLLKSGGVKVYQDGI